MLQAASSVVDIIAILVCGSYSETSCVTGLLGVAGCFKVYSCVDNEGCLSSHRQDAAQAFPEVSRRH